MALKRLEPCAGKLACTVLRGANCSNAVCLLGESIGEVGFSAEIKNKIDLVVISKYSRTIKSSGSQALGLLMTAFNQRTEPADLASLKIAIIELKTGKLIWANTSTVINASFISSATKSEENKSIKEFILAVLKPLTEKK